MTLAEFLTERGLSQAAFGAEIGVSGASISRWIGGQRAPSASQVRKIKKLTNGRVTADDLLCPVAAE